MWAALERPQPLEAEVSAYRTKLTAIAAAQEAGRIRGDIPVAELLAMVLALVTSWDTASWSLKALHPDAGSEGRKEAVRAAVAGLVRSPGGV